jgi:hypothetical protein
MNRTILKLFTQACYHGEYDPENVPNDVVEKFAELIINECSQISEDHQRIYYESHGDRIAKKIKQHFGVEE